MSTVADTTELWGEFVVLAENRSAVRAARRVVRGLAKQKSSKNGPVLFHGPSGTGKSALVATILQAITSDDATGGVVIRCTSALELPRRSTDEGEGSGPDDFADHLLCDLLIVEDIQHLPLKSVDALCRLIDYRLARQRPTILTASAGPAGLKQFPRRLTSRLSGGLSLRLDLPGVESRKILTRQFAERRKVMLDDSAIDWLAENYTGGVRPLIGAIEQLRGTSRGKLTPLDAGKISEWLKQSTVPNDPAPLDRIVNRVSLAFGVKPDDVLGHARQRNVMIPRQVAMYLARLVAKVPLTRIAAYFGGRDHTTVMHSLQKIEASIQSDASLAGTVRELQSELE